ncbi:hypothetical protein [Parerythrobacter aestuarii]|uniref:hypothetical protein n=1 Tax=Parerythrobacter aestuarii TaxID=3020909 RepID=UPI0024DED17C|nr:hypothetical protein [Parerythrobacter aestuarii]
MRMLTRFNPTSGIQDFWNEFRRPQPYRIPILLVSAAFPIVLIFAFVGVRSEKAALERPEVFYITTFEPGRTDEEIMASNLENQKLKEELAARRAEIEERKKDAYRALGRATGLDVDAMERQIEEDRAREEAAQQQAQQAGDTGAPDSN